MAVGVVVRTIEWGVPVEAVGEVRIELVLHCKDEVAICAERESYVSACESELREWV